MARVVAERSACSNGFSKELLDRAVGTGNEEVQVNTEREPVQMIARIARRFGIVASLALLVATAFTPSISGAALAAKPVVLSVIVSPKTLPASGGVVSVIVRDKSATTCTVAVLPSIKGFPSTFRCAAGHFVTSVHVPVNTQPNGQTITFSVTAHGVNGRSPTRTAVVSQATDTGPIGATLNVHDFSGNELAVTMTQIVDPAIAANPYFTPNPGDRFVAVEMSLLNQSSATITDDANGDVTVIGTDSQAYTADFDSVAECTNFDYGGSRS